MSESLAAALNRTCFCITLDSDALGAALREESGDPAFHAALVESRPHLFSRTPVFLPEADRAAMRAVIAAIEAAAALPGFLDAARAWMPPIAAIDHGPRGVFMGYDFHLGEDGPKLIEVNTNAGGAYLNALLARAQIACCAPVEQALMHETPGAFERAVMAMFEAEWRRQGRTAPLRRVAIVDDAPERQYLYSEFVLARRLFERHGVGAVVADASALRFEGGALRDNEGPIDLVYNRLVDFTLEEPAHAALSAAYVEGAAVVTPGPRNHAQFADKRNLTLLSDQAALGAWGLPAPLAAVLARAVPRAVRVTAEAAEVLWARRKGLFFKPATGHGSKAVYRGDKITRSVWASILAGDYIAQDLTPPSERTIALDGAPAQRKLDVRLYAYAGEPLLAAARLYQGQTTNMRTPGGGFAPVFFV